VRSPEVHRAVLRQIAEAALDWDAATVGVADSGLPGPKGNREFFLHLVHQTNAVLPPELDDWIEHAVG
jgi:predicted rRNA methylase YqxC with S4 and FtsJ domains